MKTPLSYTVSGVTFTSDLPLPAGRSSGGERAVRVVMGAPTDATYERRPGSDVVAELMVDGWPRYTFVRARHGYTCRVYGIADFEISAELDRVVCRADPTADAALVPILVCGTIVSFLLMARGQMVLHASAVALPGGTVGFVGPPLQGKSTLATMMCLAGGRLLADDVLPLHLDEVAVRAVPGTGLLRLREGATTLLERFGAEGASATRTPDLRTGLVPPAVEHVAQPLAALALPRPTREAGAGLEVRRLPVPLAALRLAQGTRIEGWHGAEDLIRWFQAAAHVAERVPVYELQVPWGPPFADDLPQNIVRALGLGEPVSA